MHPSPITPDLYEAIAVGVCLVSFHSCRGGGLRLARWVWVSSLLFTPDSGGQRRSGQVGSQRSASARTSVLELMRACGITTPPPVR